MDFEFSEQEEDIRRAASEFAQKELAKQEIENLDHVPMQMIKRMGELGFLGMKTPEAYGGSPSSWLESGLVVEEIAKGNSSLAYLVMISCQLGRMLSEHASDEVKKDWLCGVCRGDSLGSISLSEIECGSDYSGIKTTASRDGASYVLRGDKRPVGFGTQADFSIVFAGTEMEGNGCGVTALLVPLDQRGVSRCSLKNMGLLPSSPSALVFDGVRVPEEYRLGKEGEGMTMNIEYGISCKLVKVLLGLIGLGVAQHALNLAISYAKKRTAFGRPIVQFQAISGKIAEASTLIEMGRWACYRALWLKDRSLPFDKEAAMCGWWCPRTAYQVVEDALLIHGHSGYSADHPFQQMLRDVIGLEVTAGREQAMKLAIACNCAGKLVIPDDIVYEGLC